MSKTHAIKTNAAVLEAYALATRTRQRAHAPYSRFKVGAAIRFKDDPQIYVGCNVENASFGATICAERSALCSAVARSSSRQVDFVVLVTNEADGTVPCALCLQVLAEFCEDKTPIYIGNLSGLRRKLHFRQLLPQAFREFQKGG